MTFGNLLTFIITCTALANAYRYVDCFDNLPTDWSFEGQFSDQAKLGCLQRCQLKNSKYFAISSSSSNQCYCGDELPINGENNIDKEEICGGSSSSYSLFSVIGFNDEKFNRRDDVQITTTQTEKATVSNSQPASQAGGNSGSTNASPTSGTPSTPISTKMVQGSSVVVATSTAAASTAPQSNSNSAQSTAANSNSNTYVFRTSTKTQSGTDVTRTLTRRPQPTPAPNQDKNGKNHHHHVNVGAIVGGVVGGVGGAAVATILLLLLIRHLNKRREQERMEQEYQEAIKPVDFGGLGNRGGSTGGVSGYTGTGFTSTNNGSDKAQQLGNTSVHSLNQGPSSGSFDDDVRSTLGQNTNPFDDSRRISNHSFRRSASPSSHKILTVVNPDEED